MAVPDTLRLNELRLNRITGPDGVSPPRTLPPPGVGDYIATTAYVQQAVTASTFQFPPGQPGQVWTVADDGQPRWQLPDYPSFSFPAGTRGQIWAIGSNGQPSWQNLTDLLPEAPQPGQVLSAQSGGQLAWTSIFPEGAEGQVWSVLSNGRPGWRTLQLPQPARLVAGANVTVEYDVPEPGQVRISAHASDYTGWCYHPRVLEQDFVVRSGYTLVVGAPFAVAEGVTLTVEPGGTLVVV